MSEEIANNNQVEDWLASGKKQRIDFSGKTLELKYILKSEDALKRFLERTGTVKTNIQEIKKELKFSRVICRFHFGGYIPSEDLQKKLVDFQKDIFDEVTVQMIEDNFDVFKVVLDYAVNTSKKEVSTLIDLKIETKLLSEINKHLISVRPTDTRWIARKISTYIDRYRLISADMQEAGIPYYAVSCRKRCSTNYKDCQNVSTSIILRHYFGFKGCCQNYLPSVKDRNTGKKKGFPIGMDKFDTTSYEWKIVKNSNHRDSRLNDFFNLDSADISQRAISLRPRVKLLLAYLDKL